MDTVLIVWDYDAGWIKYDKVSDHYEWHEAKSVSKKQFKKYRKAVKARAKLEHALHEAPHVRRNPNIKLESTWPR